MIRRNTNWIILCLLGLLACQPEKVSLPNTPNEPEYQVLSLSMSQEAYYDKVLGALVGSAIGDAMGAGTEMWHRSDIRDQYGYIQALTSVTRPKSPEGIWAHNMQEGSTTDDTRWKHLMAHYLMSNANRLSPSAFAEMIISYYQDQVDELGGGEVKSSPDLLDDHLEKVAWIKEWARVALAKEASELDYEQALHRFYGGEMSCAGMLYAPMFGLIESQPFQSYLMAYQHALFDIGYAKDITALSAALTSMALQTNDIDSILGVITFIDPYHYKDSRLVGRLTESIALESVSLVQTAINHKRQDSSDVIPPQGYPGSLTDWSAQEAIYQELEKRQKTIAFHSGEIFQILIAGLSFGNGDFEKTMQFIVNYGRDNDTVGAIAGFILGAKVGFSNLPDDMKMKVLAVNKESIGIDIELLAQQLTETFYQQL